MPFDRVSGEEVTEELGDDAQAVGFVAVDVFVIFNELALEEFAPETVEFAESAAC